MDTSTVTIVSFAHFGKEFLEKIVAGVEHELLCRVEIKEKHLDLSEFFDPGRRQYNGDKLLKLVDSMEFEGSTKIIALFNVDLYIPILTYIFGQAQLGGRTAIASLYRLSNERYGIANDDASLLDRFQKEVIHELGHLFGLIHCHTPTCVMRSSTYVEDIDQKDIQLCEKCRLALGIA
jgi:archaemetzincin